MSENQQESKLAALYCSQSHLYPRSLFISRLNICEEVYVKHCAVE